MKIFHSAALILSALFCLVGAAPLHATEGAKVRLFILSGQSNMARFDPAVSFTPAVKRAFPDDALLVVKSGQGGQPIRRWYKGWKAPAGVRVKQGAVGDLYDVLLREVREA